MMMNKYNRQKSIYNVIFIVKLTVLFFCLVIVYSKLFKHNIHIINTRNGYYNIVCITVLTAIIGILYWIWTFFAVNVVKLKYICAIQYIENFIFIIIFAIIIIKSNIYITQYKFLFLFIIITSTIQSGMKHGIFMALASAVIVLTIDLIYTPTIDGVNTCFQNDLIIAGIFVLTAWPLGYYVKMEQENIEQKEFQLELLNDKLSEEHKERKYIEEMILKNQDCYNLLIENSKDAILIHRKNKFIFANESAIQMLGYNNPNDLKVKSILDFTSCYKKNSIKEKFKKLYNKEIDKVVFEDKIIKGNNEFIIIENISTCFIYEGQLTILTILHDITSEKQVEKLQKDVEKNIELLNESREYNKLITEFLSNISHELKTPLNVIFSAIQLLGVYNINKNNFVPKRKKYLKIMKINCYRLIRLINNLLDITKLDSGFVKLSPKNCDIVNFVENIVLSVASYVETKGINLIFDTNVEEKITAFDPDKMERIVLNLLSNAIKFTNDGGMIYVNLVDEGNRISISIKDTGIGIPQDKMKLIFERFGQVDKTFRRDREGSGIGLYLVKRFVEMHKGTIKVNSKIGEGSEFIVTFPVKILEYKNSKDSYLYNINNEKISIEFSDIYLGSKYK